MECVVRSPRDEHTYRRTGAEIPSHLVPCQMLVRRASPIPFELVTVLTLDRESATAEEPDICNFFDYATSRFAKASSNLCFAGPSALFAFKRRYSVSLSRLLTGPLCVGYCFDLESDTAIHRYTS